MSQGWPFSDVGTGVRFVRGGILDLGLRVGRWCWPVAVESGSRVGRMQIGSAATGVEG